MRDEPSYFRALVPLTQSEVGGDVPTGSQRLLSLLRLGSDSPKGRGWRAIAASATLVGAVTIVGFWIEPIIKGTNLAILYMLLVVFTALRWGRRAAIVSAVSSAVLFDYFFVPPYRTFSISDISYLITLIGLLGIGLLVSMLMISTQEEAQAARAREAQTAALYSLTKSLATESDPNEMLNVIERHLVETFHRPITIWMPGESGLTARFCNHELSQDTDGQTTAGWVFKNAQEAGCGTSKFPDSRMHYLPLKTWQGVVGVLGIQVDSSKRPLVAQQRQLLGTFANQAALAITRAVLANEAKRTEVLEETDKLQKALLNSISHNLRTPIASIVGAISSVLEDGTRVDAIAQRRLLQTAHDETIRLNRLVQNLLDMSRLEGGAIRLNKEPCDVHDLIGAALEQLGEPSRKRPISVVIASDLPLVPMDQVLTVQVLVNLLDNALKYSPPDAPIQIEARRDDDRVEVRVADCGTGIPEQDLDRVFEKFFRSASPGSPRGAGLGLSICKGFVESQDGRIWAKRRAEGGTEVAFFLPLRAK